VYRNAEWRQEYFSFHGADLFSGHYSGQQLTCSGMTAMKSSPVRVVPAPIAMTGMLEAE
jgi:hypothetical protein